MFFGARILHFFICQSNSFVTNEMFVRFDEWEHSNERHEKKKTEEYAKKYSVLRLRLQTNLSYETFQGKNKIDSHKTVVT
jgi:hypothetical protein